jgi:HEAT repeat protein
MYRMPKKAPRDDDGNRRLAERLLLSACLLFLLCAGELYGQPIDLATDDLPVHVKVLVRALKQSRAPVRREALTELAAIGPLAADAIPDLLDCLGDSDPLIRAYAARAAWRLGADQEILLPVLIELIDPAQPKVYGVAVLVVGNIGPAGKDAVPALQACLKARSEIVRLRAAESILRIEPGSPAALGELLSTLRDGACEARYMAANALGATAIALRNSHAICALEMALADADPSVAVAAAINLYRLDDRLPNFEGMVVTQERPSPAELTQLIADLSHSSSVIRRMAAVELGLAGTSARRALPALYERLDDDDPAVQVQAANAVWTINQEAGPIVRRLAQLIPSDNTSVSIASAYVLGRIGRQSSPALSALRERLAVSEALEHLFLAAVVSRIQPADQAAVGMLLGDLHDSDGDVRYLSALMLRDAPLASRCLVENELSVAMCDRNLRVQLAAAESLRRLRLRQAACRAGKAPHHLAQDQSSPVDPSPSVRRQNDTATEAHRESSPQRVLPAAHYSFTSLD